MNEEGLTPGLRRALEMAAQTLQGTGAPGYSVDWSPDDPAAGVTIRPEWGSYRYRDQHPEPPHDAMPLPAPESRPAEVRQPLRLIPHPAMKLNAGDPNVGSPD